MRKFAIFAAVLLLVAGGLVARTNFNFAAIYNGIVKADQFEGQSDAALAIWAGASQDMTLNVDAEKNVKVTRSLQIVASSAPGSTSSTPVGELWMVGASGDCSAVQGELHVFESASVGWVALNDDGKIICW